MEQAIRHYKAPGIRDYGIRIGMSQHSHSVTPKTMKANEGIASRPAFSDQDLAKHG